MHHNEVFSYPGRGWPMWMPPVPPAGWQLAPVETAKPKQPERQEVFAFGSKVPPWVAPPGYKWQFIEAKKEEEKQEKKEEKKEEKKDEKKTEKLPEVVLKVRMCCSKCVDKVKEEIREIPGVKDVKTDQPSSKVTVVGKVDETRVLRHAKKVDWRAKVIEVKKVQEKKEEKKEEVKKKDEDTKKKEEKKEEPNTKWNPNNYYPYYSPYFYPYSSPAPFEVDSTYYPSQAYSPPYYYPQYPETDYSYYTYPHNPRYLTHVKLS